jgi:hypothetical protein
VQFGEVTAFAEAAENDDQSTEKDSGRAVTRREHPAGDAAPTSAGNVEDPGIIEEIAEAIAPIGNKDLIAEGIVD